MNRKQILAKAKKLPDHPGVYFFKNGQKILYIGRATSLKDRVKSYAIDDLASSRSPIIKQMVEEATSVVHKTTDSVLEALILEAYLIKQYQPPYNTREKDNKSFNYVVITEETYPRLLIVRGRELDNLKGEEIQSKNRAKPSRSQSVREILKRTPIKKTFGPFPSGSALQEALKIIRKIFPFRDRKCVPAEEQKNPQNPKPCFNHQIGLCPGVCTGEISKREYQRYIRNITLFLEGKKKSLMKKLDLDMNRSAQKQEFEKAGEIKRQIHSLQHINDTALLTRDVLRQPQTTERRRTYRIEAYDVAHLAGDAHVGVMTVIENKECISDEYRTFNIRTRTKADDIGALREILSRRLNHAEWRLPNLIVVDGGKAKKKAVEYVIYNFSLDIPVVAVVKDDRHKPKNIIGKKDIIKKHQDSILLANRESHRFAIQTHRKRLRKQMK